MITTTYKYKFKMYMCGIQAPLTILDRLSSKQKIRLNFKETSPYRITHIRIKYVTGISILYSKQAKEPPNLFSFTSPLSTDVWLYMATAFLGVSFLMFILARFVFIFLFYYFYYFQFSIIVFPLFIFSSKILFIMHIKT